MTLTSELDLDSVKVNQHAKRSLSPTVVVQTHRHKTNGSTWTTNVISNKQN